MFAAGLWLCLGAAAMQAQSTQTPPANPAPAQQDNPFPGETTPAKGQSPSQTPSQSTGQKPGSTKPQPKSSSDNPFPGEDSGAPILPVDPGPGADSGSAGRSPRPGTDSAGTGRRDADPDGDPVRSPDSPVHRDTDDGFSSSRAGMKDVPAEDENGAKPGKSTRAKTREEQVKELALVAHERGHPVELLLKLRLGEELPHVPLLRYRRSADTNRITKY